MKDEPDQTLKGFIGSYLNVEVAHDGIEAQIRDAVHGFGPAYSNSLKGGFEEVLAGRELSVDDYDGLTYIEFASEDALSSSVGRDTAGSAGVMSLGPAALHV
jgi:hypothetical protein